MFETQSDEVEGVSRFQYWLPLVVSLVATPIVCLLVGITTIEGDVFYPKIVFPFSIIVVVFFRWLSVAGSAASVSLLVGSVLGLAIAQFPIYGLILSWAKRRDVTILILIGVHAIVAIMAFILSPSTAIHYRN